MWVWLTAYLLAINLFAFATFAFDKARARSGGRRASERFLLWVAAIGGTPGAMAAQQILRHKTKKEPFRTRLWLIWIVQASALALLALRGPLLDLVGRVARGLVG